MAEWTRTLGDVALCEFILLALLVLWRWRRHPTPGAGWAATSFGLLAVLGTVGHVLGWMQPTIPPQWFFKLLIGVVLVVPFCLYRFASTFGRPRRWVRYTAVVLTVGVMVDTALLPYLPFPHMPTPPGWLFYRLAVAAQWGFLVTFVAMRMWMAGAREPTAVRNRMRLLAAAAAGLNIQVIVGTLEPDRPLLVLVSQVVTVVTAVLFFLGWVFPARMRYWWRRNDANALRTAIADLVTAVSPGEVASGLLPHVCTLVGASRVALVDHSGTAVAEHTRVTADAGEDPAPRHWADDTVSVEMRFGQGHRLVVWTSPYMPFFGREELRILAGLGDLLGLAMERCELAERERAANEALAHQALHDALTGLPNRTLFLDRLTQALASVERHGSTLAVLFVDLDRFKLINDGIDHAAGDTVLVEVASRLSGVMRSGDTVARFGGDEFVVVAEVGDDDEALAVADRLRHAVTLPVVLGGRELSVTASVGVVVTSNQIEPNSLLRDADAAMYLAKESGRDRVELFDESIRVRARQRLDLEHELGQAIGANEFCLHYQPIFGLVDGSLVGVEALVRWRHPQRGLLLPGEFVSAAEESGLIVALDTWVLQEACRQTAAWRGRIPGAEAITTWVNMSADQFRREDLIGSVVEVLEATRLEPTALGVEITENVFMSDTTQLRANLAGLKSLGISIAIDDFGTGFSSLGYLKRFPVDVIKIDASFVQGIGREPDTSLVTACLALACALGITTVAEGVEERAQGTWLAGGGCDRIQGFFSSPPLSADAATDLIAQERSLALPFDRQAIAAAS